MRKNIRKTYGICAIAATAILAMTAVPVTSYAATASYNIPGGKMVVIGGGSLAGISGGAASADCGSVVQDILSGLRPGANGSGNGNSGNLGSGKAPGGKPECPEVPDAPAHGKPAAPEIEVPDHVKPDVPELEIPETPDTGKPDVPEIEIPETPDNETPDAPEYEKPDVAEIEIPDMPGTETPDVPEFEIPETPGAGAVQDAFADQVVELVNKERAKAGLSPLTVHSAAAEAAQTRAEELETKFSHTRPDGSDFSTALSQVGVSYQGSGENIAYGQTTPEQVMESWMNSSGHRANILNSNYTSIGVGHYEGADGADYWVQLFVY